MHHNVTLLWPLQVFLLREWFLHPYTSICLKFEEASTLGKHIDTQRNKVNVLVNQLDAPKATKQLHFIHQMAIWIEMKQNTYFTLKNLLCKSYFDPCIDLVRLKMLSFGYLVVQFPNIEFLSHVILNALPMVVFSSSNAMKKKSCIFSRPV